MGFLITPELKVESRQTKPVIKLRNQEVMRDLLYSQSEVVQRKSVPEISHNQNLLEINKS